MLLPFALAIHKCNPVLELGLMIIVVLLDFLALYLTVKMFVGAVVD
jgi:hypothetical protein